MKTKLCGQLINGRCSLFMDTGQLSLFGWRFGVGVLCQHKICNLGRLTERETSSGLL